MDGDEEVPDHLRCRRTDGRRWRCRHRALQNVSFCELHFIQARRRQNKLAVPESLKLRRRPRRSPSEAQRKRKAEHYHDDGATDEKKRKTDEGLLIGLMSMVMRRKRKNAEKEERVSDPEPGSGVQRKVKVEIKDDGSDHECMRTEIAAIAAMPVMERKVRSRRKIGRRKEAAVAPLPAEGSQGNGLLKEFPPKEAYLSGHSTSTVVSSQRGVGGTQENGLLMELALKEASAHSTSKVVPDHLRCRRNDGKQWRCSRPALEKHCFCELHHIQAFRRQYKLGVPDSLKLQRKPRGPSGSQSHQSLVKVTLEGIKIEKKTEKKKEKRRKKIESLLVELMQMVLQRQIERRVKKEKRRRLQAVEVTRYLPNGLMAISPVTSAGHSNNVGGHLERKLGLDPSSFLQWCFRSKNVEHSPVGTVKMFPYVRKALGLGKTQKRICHHCRNSNICRTIRCSSCRKVFCRSCIKKWYSKLTVADVREACPICRGKCSCIACLPEGPREPDIILQKVMLR